MIDLVIPYKEDSDKGSELRYCLRSFNKYFKDLGSVVIVGDCPSWIKNVVHIPVRDIPGEKAKSICNKILVATELNSLSERFIYSADDIFLLKEIRERDIKYWFDSHLANLHKKARSGYKEIVFETMKVLGSVVENFDVHAPIIFEKSKFRKLNSIPQNILVKTHYCHEYQVEPREEIRDLKYNRQIGDVIKFEDSIKGRLFFSTDSHVVQDTFLSQFMEAHYPKPCKFEN